MTDKEELAFQYQRGYTDGFLEGKKTFERPHGEWIRKCNEHNVDICCTNCGYDDGYSCFKYCPNCGADMRPKKKIQTPSCLTNPERQAELLERYKEE